MRITPVVNNFYIKSGITALKPRVTPSFSAQNNQIPSKIYYFVNTQNPKEERIYSSTDPVMLERPANFPLNRFTNIPCPACGKLMLTQSQYDNFLSKLRNTKNEDYLKLLENYKPYMRPIETSVLEEMQQLSERTGEKDIRTLIVMLEETKLPKLQEIQRKKLKQMQNLAKSLPDDERQTLTRKLDKLSEYIRKKNPEAPFRRKIMIEKISRVHIKNQNKYKKLQNIAQSFPTSKDANSAWIVKYAGKNKQGEDWSSFDIANRLLEFSVPNTDHIIARDLVKNKDEISNYMGMHSACNGQKANKPFLQWYYEDEHLRRESLNAYFKHVNKIIYSGKVRDKRYDNYVANATQNIFEASKGVVDINYK